MTIFKLVHFTKYIFYQMTSKPLSIPTVYKTCAQCSILLKYIHTDILDAHSRTCLLHEGTQQPSIVFQLLFPGNCEPLLSL